MVNKIELTPDQRITLMNQRDKNTIEIIRATFRPILIGLLGVGAFFLIINEIETEFANWWIRIFLLGGCEWILERPIIKIFTGIKAKQ